MTVSKHGKIVAAFSLTHTPGLGNRLDDCPPDQLSRLMAAFDAVREEVDKTEPEVIIAFVNDHFDMHVLENLPTFAVGVSDTHYGPSKDAEAWLQQTRRDHPGHESYARDILFQGVSDGFDLTRIGACEFNHNVLIPKKFIWPEKDIPIVPVFINCFSDPLPAWERCYRLGQSIRRVIDRRPERVALCASGGISHWPPFVKEDAPKDDDLLQRQLKVQRHGAPARAQDPNLRADFHAREAKMASSERELINIAWDREILDAFGRGDVDYLLSQTHEEVERLGGIGGHEMMLWAALMAVLDGAPGQTLVYEPVKEWMGGVGVISYELALGGA